ncbi:hypothetical protein BDY24DRAFT_442136 [Mrakia frigida]|uniref:uncharacterized protein n=1 Tax=Mrakia frigida TaxID=29902 RepID=UPI003FCC069B
MSSGQAGRRPSATSSYYLSTATQDQLNPSQTSLTSTSQGHSHMDRKGSSSSHHSHSQGRKQGRLGATSASSALEPSPSSRQDPVKKKQSWKNLRKKPSLSQKEPPTPTYIHHPPVSHLSPAPPLPTKYTSLPLRTGPPLSSLYLVAGLPKQTHTWTVADASSIQGVQHRPGAVGGWWRAEVLGSNTAPVANGTAGGGGNEEGEAWSQRLSGKALKYSFTREIEIISSTLQPPSTVHSFSFDLASPDSASTGLVRDSDHIHRSSTSSTKDGTTTYHGVTLTVFSHADPTKTAAIRKALDVAAAHPPQTSTSSKFESSTSGVVPSRSGAFGILSNGGDARTRTGSLTGGGEFWLPYALTLVSKFPIYSIMSDYLKISWAKFSKDVANHSRQMTKIIQTPSPRAGDLVRLRISSPSADDEQGDSDPDALEIVASFPGQLDMNSGLIGIGLEQWPFFKVLSLDNVITVVETALSPNGRVVFHSRHPALLGIAVMTLKYICELRGWEGMAHPIVHARDVQLFIEDAGPYILGLDTECKYITKIATDICVVDLDINFVNIPAPAFGVLSTNQTREKIKSRLVKAFGDGKGFFTEHTVPAEFMEAYPGGRLRPLCETRSASGDPDALSAERIEAPLWWEQGRVMAAFDQLLAYKSKKPGFFKRLGGGDKPKTRELSMGEKIARSNMRKRANQFVDARDEMESKLGRLSRRLAFLVHETDVWKERFTQFEELTEKLGTEANDLKSRIEKEKRESRRLSSVVGEKEKEKENLRAKLRETEEARYAALGKMQEMETAMRTIERERDEMIASISDQLEDALGTINVAENGTSVASSSRPNSRNSSHRSDSRNGGGGKPSDALQKLGSNGTGASGLKVVDAVSEESTTTPKKKRFSAMGGRGGKTDPFDEIDDRITASSISVQDKVSAIQLKLDLALKSITAHNARQSMDGGRGSFDVDDRDYAGSPSTPNVDDLDPDAPTSPITPVPSSNNGTGGQVLSAISSIFSSSSHPISNDTPRQSVVAADTPPPSSFKPPNEAHRSSAEVSADTTDSQEEFQSADEGHRSTSPVSSDEEEGFDSKDDPTLTHDEQPRRRDDAPPRAARTKYIRPPSTTAFGIAQPHPLPVVGKHKREESDMSSSTTGETDADRTLTMSTSSESVASESTATRKKSTVTEGEEEDLIVPELGRMPRKQQV